MTTARHFTPTGGSAQDTTASTVTWELVHAEPRALVYAVPRAKPSASPIPHGAPVPTAGWTPSASPEHHDAAEHDAIEHPFLHYAGYVGRVGVLATALGVGAAVAGTSGNALAQPNGGNPTTSSSEPSKPASAGDSAPTPQTGQRSAGSRVTTTQRRSASAPGSGGAVRGAPSRL